jgi:adenine-specific DNA methylase
LTGLGKWWGRKPLVLVRAAVLGCLMPASDNPEKDMEIFLKLMSMDQRRAAASQGKISLCKGAVGTCAKEQEAEQLLWRMV